jgi:hypothetical protein
MSTKKIQSIPQRSTADATHPRYESVLFLGENDIDHFVSDTLLKAIPLAHIVKHEVSPSLVIQQLKSIERLTDVPDLIFIDMDFHPADAYQFLQDFTHLSDFIRSRCKIIAVLANEADHNMNLILANPCVIRKIDKPLDAYHLKEFFQ